MRLFPKELEIAADEGFLPKKDIFNRKPFGEQLTRIVTSLEGPNVLLLDAEWGTGKTTFLKMWRGELIKIGIPSIYFDAFANDYQEDAFIAVASQIIAEAEAQNPKKSKELKIFKQKAISTAKVLGRALFRFGIHAASAGVVQGEHLEKAAASIMKDAGDETAKAMDEILKERLESHTSDQLAFEEFKTALSTLSSTLSPKIAGQSKQHPLVFIIDELDRCKPSFALALLEKIKHFFSVPNVVFILVSSLPQLESAVKYAYGEIDARTYLEKFYYLRIEFPTGRIDRPDLGVETYLRHINCHKNDADIISLFSSVYPLSFRTLERIAAYSKIVRASAHPQSLFLPQVISVLCILKVIQPNLYKEARSGKLKYSSLDTALKFKDWKSISNPTHIPTTIKNVEDIWRFALNQTVDPTFVEGFEPRLFGHNLDISQVISYFCDLIDGFSFPEAA